MYHLENTSQIAKLLKFFVCGVGGIIWGICRTTHEKSGMWGRGFSISVDWLFGQGQYFCGSFSKNIVHQWSRNYSSECKFVFQIKNTLAGALHFPRQVTQTGSFLDATHFEKLKNCDETNSIDFSFRRAENREWEEKFGTILYIIPELISLVTESYKQLPKWIKYQQVIQN